MAKKNQGGETELIEEVITAAYKVLANVHVGGKLFRKGTTAQLTEAQATSAGTLVKPVATPKAAE